MAIPGLADLTQDIAGPLSVSLLSEWTSGERTSARAHALLAPYRREGIVGASDASGLSKLTQERDLLEVLWLVAEPKQILHGIGKGIGGEAIGVWVADNTEMFYPANIPVDAVLAAMIETQARIAERCSVMIGICLHVGVFYELGGGLYGSDAHAVEMLAEDHARAQEIIVTGELLAKLREPGEATFERRDDLDALHRAGVHRVRSAQRFPALGEAPGTFPHAFPKEFFAELPKLAAQIAAAPPSSRVPGSARGPGSIPPGALDGPAAEERFIVFLVREKASYGEDDLAALLDNFVADALMRATVEENVDKVRHIAESGGGLAILVFENGNEAFAAARLVQQRLQDKSLQLKIGVDHGPVLLFRHADGTYGGIAGDAVNLASKLSEDLGHPGRISISSRAAEHIEGLSGAEPFSTEISRVTVSGVIF